MKFPLVSRGMYDDARQDLALAHADLALERLQVSKLTETIIDMKVTGATVRAAVTGDRPRLALPVREPSDVEKALDKNDRTRRDLRLRARMLAWADEMIRAGKDKDEVIEKLLTWNQVDGADDDDDEVAI